MQLRLLLTYCTFFSFLTFLTAQLELDWIQPIEERYRSGFILSSLNYVSTVATADGSAYAVGFSGSGFNHDLLLGREEVPAAGAPSNKFFVAGFEPNGEVRWAKRFTGHALEGINDLFMPRIVADPTGGMFLVSFVRSTVVLGSDTLGNQSAGRALLIAKLDASGEVEYTNFISTSTDEFHAVQLARNGDLLITGRNQAIPMQLGAQTASVVSRPSFFVARVNPRNGSVTWLGGISATENWLNVGTIYALIETRSGDIVAGLSPGGISFRIIGCRPDAVFGFRIIRLNGGDGSLRWVRRVMNHGFGFLSGIAENPSGDLYLTGEAGGELRGGNGEFTIADVSNCNDYTGFLLKMHADGSVYDLLFQPDGFVPEQLSMLPNGDYFVAGENNGWLPDGAPRPTANAEVRYYNRYDQEIATFDLPASASSSQRNSPISMTLNPDGRSLMVSALYNIREDAYNFVDDNILYRIAFLARFNISDVTTEVSTVAEEDIIVFPNPTDGFLNLSTPGGTTADWKFTLTDLSGQVLEVTSLSVDRSQQTLDLSQLPAGIYHLTIEDPQRRFTRRIVVH